MGLLKVWLGPWFAILLVSWSFGPLVRWSSGPLVFGFLVLVPLARLFSSSPVRWFPGPLVPWSSGPPALGSSGPWVVLWSTRARILWSLGSSGPCSFSLFPLVLWLTGCLVV